MGQISNIAKGWANYLGSDATAKQIERAKICDGCDSAVDGTYEKLMPDYSLKEIQGKKCAQCDCPLSTLLRQDGKKCELGKW